jgi:uncharacterized protein (TIGR02145 family)
MIASTISVSFAEETLDYGYQRSLFSCLLTKVMLDYNGNMPLDLYNSYMSNMTTVCDPEPTIQSTQSYMEEITAPYDIMNNVISSPVNSFVCGTDVVYDGFTYNTTVMPDGKCWTKQNMKHLPKVGKSWNFGDTVANLAINATGSNLGRLYDWNAAMGVPDMSGGMTETGFGVCQSLGNGWKLPSDADWSGLKYSVGGSWSGNTIATSMASLRNPALTNQFPMTDSYSSWWSSSINPITGQFTMYNPLYFSIVCIYDDAMTLNSAPSENVMSSWASLNIGIISGFDIILPESARVGESLSIIVMAVDAGSNIVSNYTDKIFFQSTDTSATIPYATTGVQFTESDTGFLNLENSITFTQTGLQTITITDTNGKTGSASIMILP